MLGGFLTRNLLAVRVLGPPTFLSKLQAEFEEPVRKRYKYCPCYFNLSIF